MKSIPIYSIFKAYIKTCIILEIILLENLLQCLTEQCMSLVEHNRSAEQ